MLSPVYHVYDWFLGFFSLLPFTFQALVYLVFGLLFVSALINMFR